MAQISIKFDTDKEEINKQLFLFSPSMTIREMLEEFLKQTNSLTKIDSNDIQFFYKGKILNTDSYFDKYVRDIFKLSNHKIKVWDSKNIIGGKKIYKN